MNRREGQPVGRYFAKVAQPYGLPDIYTCGGEQSFTGPKDRNNEP